MSRSNGLGSWIHGHVVAQARADHRVLAHQDRRLAAELDANLLHLLRADLGEASHTTI